MDRTGSRPGRGTRSRDGRCGRSSRSCRRRVRGPGPPRRGTAEVPRRSHDPPPPTRTKNGSPRMTVSREVAASPRKKPAANCLASMGRPRRGADAQSPAPRSRRSSSGSQSSTALAATARGSPSRASAIARNVSPTATMWARYQVDPSWLANQKTVPSPKNTVVARRTVGRIGSRPRTQKARPTTSAPNPTAMSDSLVVRPKTATNGMSTSAGNGGNGMSARPVGDPFGRSIGRTSLK